MTDILRSSLLVLGLSLGSAAFAFGGNVSIEQSWPQWRGPLANGVAPAANPPTQWSEVDR